MKLSEKQAVMLITLLQSSLEKNVVGYLCYDFPTRSALLNEIINQQDESLIQLEHMTNE